MSGSVTISMRGTPERLKSTRLTRSPSAPLAVDELGRVLLEVGARDRTVKGPSAVSKVSRPGGQRQVVLADLVALGQVRVEVVLAIPAGRVGGRGLDGGAGGEHELHGAPVDDRERTRQAEADRADVAVRPGAVIRGRAGAEHLRIRAELAVDLDADDRLVALSAEPRLVWVGVTDMLASVAQHAARRRGHVPCGKTRRHGSRSGRVPSRGNSRRGAR